MVVILQGRGLLPSLIHLQEDVHKIIHRALFNRTVLGALLMLRGLCSRRIFRALNQLEPVLYANTKA